MLEVRFDIQKQFCIPILDGNEYSIMISSDDSLSCEIVKKIIKSVYSNKTILFRASGLLDNITELLNDFKDCNYMLFEESSRLFHKGRNPEVFAEVLNDSMLETILDDWVSTIYERRFLYILSEKDSNQALSLLKENMYSKTNCLDMMWDFLDCLIENSPDHENHNTFIVTLRKNDFYNVQRCMEVYI